MASRVFSGILAVLFFVFAIVQVNDSGPFVWMIVYGTVSVVSGFGAWNRYQYSMLIMGMVICFTGALYLAPGVWQWFTQLYSQLETTSSNITAFLHSKGIVNADISYSRPQITDKWANQYGGGPVAELRYTAAQTITIYSQDIDAIRLVMSQISSLVKQGIVLGGEGYSVEDR